MGYMTEHFTQLERYSKNNVCWRKTVFATEWSPTCLRLNTFYLDFMVTPCISSIQHFNFHVMHTTLKNLVLLKYFKISKTAPTCFGL